MQKLDVITIIFLSIIKNKWKRSTKEESTAVIWFQVTPSTSNERQIWQIDLALLFWKRRKWRNIINNHHQLSTEKYTRGKALKLCRLSDSKWFNVKINHDKIYILKRRKAQSNRKEYKDVEELNDTQKANTTSHKKKKRKQMIN